MLDRIIIHCSATPEGKPFTIDDIRRWHTLPVGRGGRGWKDIGYHYVIHLDGSVHAGRPETMIGAHCIGQNSRSLGICYIGGLAADGKTPKDTRTPSQKAALLTLIADIRRRHCNRMRVYGHRDFAPKACPCFDACGEYNAPGTDSRRE